MKNMKLIKLMISTIIIISLIGCHEKFVVCSSGKFDRTTYVSSNKHISYKDLKKINFLQKDCDTTISCKEADFMKAVLFYDYKDSVNFIKIIGCTIYRPPFLSIRYMNGCTLYYSFIVYINKEKYVLENDDKSYNKDVFNKIISNIDNKRQLAILNNYRYNLVNNSYCTNYNNIPFWNNAK